MSVERPQAGRDVTIRDGLARHGEALAVVAATLLGGFVRLAPVLAARFPLNDGGLFFTMIREIQAAHFRLPLFTAYNQASIPFLYPPLSLYFTALLSALTGIGVADLLRVLPAAISVLTIPAAYLLARCVLPSRSTALLATFSYALLPTAFDFMIVGGGLPRAMGSLFSLLALAFLARAYAQRQGVYVAASTVFAAMTLLSHPVVAWYTFFSAAVFFLFLGRNRKGLVVSLVVAAGAIALAAPWWATNLARHGLAPFLAATHTGTRSWSDLLAPFLFLHTNEPLLAIQGFLALLGIFYCLRSKSFLFAAWLLLIFLLEPRLAASYSAVPTALLAAFGFERVVLAGLGSRTDRPDDSPVQLTSTIKNAAVDETGSPRGRSRWAISGFLLVYLLIAAFLAAPRASLSTAERESMQWIQGNTPAGSRFAVISGTGPAGTDYVSEWFPALTDRVSVATPQGYEWLTGQEYDRRWSLHADLQECWDESVGCVERWAAEAGADYTHLYIVKRQPEEGAAGRPDALYTSLLEAPGYALLYDRPGVAVFARQAMAGAIERAP